MSDYRRSARKITATLFASQSFGSAGFIVDAVLARDWYLARSPSGDRDHGCRAGVMLLIMGMTGLRMRQSNYLLTSVSLVMSAPPSTADRLLQMVAHTNGQILNMNSIALSLGIDAKSVRRYSISSKALLSSEDCSLSNLI